MDRPLETRRQQPWQAADMVDMDVGEDQRTKVVDWKPDSQRIVTLAAVRRDLGALEQAAVDEHAVGGVDVELVARTGNAVPAAVMRDRI